MRRRGKNLLLSPVDWALMESWEEQGIPLRIVLSTIDELFDQIEADPKRAGSIRTLGYCSEAVEARFATWKESQVGKPEGDDEPDVASEGHDEAERLRHLAKDLKGLRDSFEGAVESVLNSAAASLEDLARRDLSAEDAEQELEQLDHEIDKALAEADDLSVLEDEARSSLGEKASRMEADVLDRTIGLMVKKRLRERSGIPMLGAFRL